MNKINYKLICFAVIIIFFTLNNNSVFAQARCDNYNNTQCKATQQEKDITIINPISGNECLTRVCADSCPPKYTYFCDPDSNEPVPAVEEGSGLIYPAYTCVNYTCIGIEAPLPQIDGTKISSLDTYFKYIYQIGLGITGVAALTMIVIGGLMYMASAGNASQKSEAKNRITSAVLGLILALGAYLILYTINPDLVKLTRVQMQYPPLPRIILKCDTTNNVCKAEEAKPGEQITDTCGEINTPCLPSCRITNAYWDKDEMKTGEEARLTIETRGKCDDIILNKIKIYEDNAVLNELLHYVNYSTGAFIEEIVPLPLKTGFPFHVSKTSWKIKEPESTFLRRINIFEGKLDYFFRASFSAKNAKEQTQEYFIESGIMKVGGK